MRNLLIKLFPSQVNLKTLINIPSWVAKLALSLGLVNKVSWLFSGDYVKTLQGWSKRWTLGCVIWHLAFARSHAT